MNERYCSLWALPPDMIADVLARGSIENMLPDGLKALFGGGEARASSDPIREGATVILSVDGVLSPKGSYGGTSLDRLASRVREFGADSKIGAIILKVSSPGGTVYGTQEAGDAIFEVRQAKPVVAIASPMAASAAYWLASQASAFYASHSADVGSVGVYGGHTDQSGFEDKIGMKTTLISAGPKKVDGHPYAPLSDEARADMQASVDESYRAFLGAVARGRGVTADVVAKTHGQGTLVSAQRAVAAGMIDGVMTLRDVIAKYSSSRSRLALMRRRAEARARSFAI